LTTRVLDVRPDDGSAIVRLHVRCGEQRHEYVTLSYCWGGLQNTTTTTENIETRIRDIPMDYLQQTIWDAVTIASVSRNAILMDQCFVITQDNAADKVVQIEAMGKIYKNSTITIPAGSAPSSKGVLVDPYYRLS